MAREKYKKKKSNVEVKRYKTSLGENGVGIQSTGDQDTYLLIGSDSFSKEQNHIRNDKENIEKRHWKLAVGDWLKENIIGIIVMSIILPLLGWMVISIIDIQRDKAVSEYRIEKLEEELNEVSGNIPNEEKIRLEIDNLKEDLDDIEAKDLEKRIDRLEILIENSL